MRYLLALVAGGAVTLVLFFFMSVLIDQGKKKPVADNSSSVVEFIRVKRDQETKTRNRELPKQPPPPTPPPSSPKLKIADSDKPQQDDLQMNSPKMENGLKGGMGPYLGRGGGGQSGDADLVPIVRISPQMPREASLKGIEGFVTMSFVVTKSGATRDVEITEAKPPRIFNREAKRAVLKWRYRPQLVDGKPVEVPQKVTLDFKLEGEE